MGAPPLPTVAAISFVRNWIGHGADMENQPPRPRYEVRLPWTIFLQGFTPVQAAMYNKIVRRCSVLLMRLKDFRCSWRNPEAQGVRRTRTGFGTSINPPCWQPTLPWRPNANRSAVGL